MNAVQRQPFLVKLAAAILATSLVPDNAVNAYTYATPECATTCAPVRDTLESCFRAMFSLPQYTGQNFHQLCICHSDMAPKYQACFDCQYGTTQTKTELATFNQQCQAGDWDNAGRQLAKLWVFQNSANDNVQPALFYAGDMTRVPSEVAQPFIVQVQPDQASVASGQQPQFAAGTQQGSTMSVQDSQGATVSASSQPMSAFSQYQMQPQIAYSAQQAGQNQQLAAQAQQFAQSQAMAQGQMQNPGWNQALAHAQAQAMAQAQSQLQQAQPMQPGAQGMMGPFQGQNPSAYGSQQAYSAQQAYGSQSSGQFGPSPQGLGGQQQAFGPAPMQGPSGQQSPFQTQPQSLGAPSSAFGSVQAGPAMSQGFPQQQPLQSSGGLQIDASNTPAGWTPQQWQQYVQQWKSGQDSGNPMQSMMGATPSAGGNSMFGAGGSPLSGGMSFDGSNAPPGWTQQQWKEYVQQWQAGQGSGNQMQSTFGAAPSTAAGSSMFGSSGSSSSLLSGSFDASNPPAGWTQQQWSQYLQQNKAGQGAQGQLGAGQAIINRAQSGATGSANPPSINTGSTSTGSGSSSNSTAAAPATPVFAPAYDPFGSTTTNVTATAPTAVTPEGNSASSLFNTKALTAATLMLAVYLM